MIDTIIRAYGDLNTTRQERTWSIGNEVVTETNSYTQLGLLCDEFKSSSALIDESAKKLRGTFGSIISCGFTPAEINTLTLRNIYCSAVLPKALYGAPLWSNYSRTDMRSLEISYRKCLKQIQTLSTYCDTTFSLVSLDMESLEEIVDLNKLQFLGQLCRWSPDHIAKQVFVHRLIRHFTHGNIVFSFIQDFWRIAKKYNVDHFIRDFVNSWDFPIKSVWKRILKTNVKDFSKHRRALTCNKRFNAKVDTFFKLSNKDNFWGTVKKNLNVAKYCYSAIRLLGYSVSRKFLYRCKHCDKLSDSYVTHALCCCF